MANLIKKYGYAIDKLKIEGGKQEIQLSIKFRIDESDHSYRVFQAESQRYIPCIHVYKEEDVIRYTHKDFSPTDEEKSLYVQSIAPGCNNAITHILNGKSNFEIGSVVLRSKDFSQGVNLLKYNYDKTFNFEGGVFSYNEFIENNAAVREMLKVLNNLKRYKHKPVKRSCTTDLWCTLKALDLFWS